MNSASKDAPANSAGHLRLTRNVLGAFPVPKVLGSLTCFASIFGREEGCARPSVARWRVGRDRATIEVRRRWKPL